METSDSHDKRNRQMSSNFPQKEATRYQNCSKLDDKRFKISLFRLQLKDLFQRHCQFTQCTDNHGDGPWIFVDPAQK